MINVKELCKNFGDLKVLKGINCEIDKGERIVIIGPSGSGDGSFWPAWPDSASKAGTMIYFFTMG